MTQLSTRDVAFAVRDFLDDREIVRLEINDEVDDRIQVQCLEEIEESSTVLITEAGQRFRITVTEL